MQTTSIMLSQPSTQSQSYQTTTASQPSIENNIELLAPIFEAIEHTDVIHKLEMDYKVGRRGYSKRAMFRAYVTKFVMGFKYFNSAIRLLRDNAEVREMCGFENLPVRTTFNRFVKNMQHYDDVIESAIAQTIDRLKIELPDLGNVVAVDSTAVHTYSNPNRKDKNDPNRKVTSDPEAKWGVKHTAKGKDGKVTEWFFGYKAHMVSDATYGIPLASITTAGNASDTVYLTKIMEKAKKTFDWFHPEAVIADRGYDSKKNNNYLWKQGIHPIIKMRQPGGKRKDKNPTTDKKLIDDIYDINGVPYCMGGQKMDYVTSDPVKGHQYVCPPAGCTLKARNSVAMVYCDAESWEDPTRDIRLFGTIRKDSDEWKNLYRKRYSVERSFKSMKQSRSLEHHTVRRLRRIHIHILMSVFTTQITVLVNLENRAREEMMWMVPRVA